MLATLGKKNLIVSVGIALVTALGILACLFLLPGSNPNQKVLAGQEIVVSVHADALEDMYGYQFQLRYDKAELEYKGGLKSKLSEITTIFEKPMNGYELVGATMIGERAGVSGKNKQVCEMVFVAKKDGVLSDFLLTLDAVNIVKSDMEYLENIEGWRYQLTIGS